MRVADFDFELPKALIAQQPAAKRDGSRMLQLGRHTGAFEDRLFTDLPELLGAGDLLVLNDSRVLPARLFGTRLGLRAQAGSPAPEGVVEVLLTEQISPAEGNVWRSLVRPAKKVLAGEMLLFGAVGEKPVLRAEVIGTGEFGERMLRFAPVEGFHAVLERIGHLPLPPYIHRSKAEPNMPEDRERYQTVYSRPFGYAAASEQQAPFGNDSKKGKGEPRTTFGSNNEKDEGETQVRGGNNDQSRDEDQKRIAGSAAAPTAGLHFTPAVLGQLKDRGVEIARVTLHVGLGTFQPVRVERTEEIRLHAEPYTLSAETAEALNRAHRDGRRIIAVGTTTTRTLEHLARQFEARYGAISPANSLRLEPHTESTGLFLSPAPDGDDRFRLVQGLLTNFHLPQSTLLMLVSAFAGRERVLAAYAHAVRERYRFFSYGDCMLVL